MPSSPPPESLNLGRLWRTIRHLKARQVVDRLVRTIRITLPDHRSAPPLRNRPGAWVRPPARADAFEHPGEVRLLNETRPLDGPADWMAPGASPLWRYHLHYFDNLLAPGPEAHRINLMERWMVEVPEGEGPAWEPYPTSRRISNWVKSRFSGRPCAKGEDDSLARQTRHLAAHLEFHLMGNHLLADAKALLLAGCQFAGTEGDRWLANGADLLLSQANEQILSDGGHFERSPLYHALVLEDLLDSLNALRATDMLPALQDELSKICARMLGFLAGVIHPDGELPFFNDCALGIAPPSAELFAYARDLSLPLPPAPPLSVAAFPKTGYFALRRGPAFLLADIGEVGPEHLPGHAHCDTLSFELSLHSQRLVTNSGTFAYQGPYRHAFRSTRAHNTVQVDDEEQHEIWKEFRVGRRGYPFGAGWALEGEEKITLEGAHTGYAHLPGGVIHLRRWELGPRALLVEDTLQGGRAHSAVSRVHLSPFVDDLRRTDAGVKFSFAGHSLELQTSDSSPEISLLQSDFSDEFNRKCSRPLIEMRIRGPLPIRMGFVIRWS